MHVLAALDPASTVYRLLLFAHVLCAIVGFGSTFVYPLIGSHAKKVRGIGAAEISNASLHAGHVLTGPFIIGNGVFGIALALTGPFEFSDRFVGISFGLYLLAIAFSYGVHQPNLKHMNRLANELASMGPPPAGATGGPPPQAAEMEKRGKDAGRNGGILSLIFVVVLLLMIFKPL